MTCLYRLSTQTLVISQLTCGLSVAHLDQNQYPHASSHVLLPLAATSCRGIGLL